MDSSSIALICFAAVTVTILAIYLVVRDISGAGTSNSGNFAKRPRLRRIRNVFDQEPSNSILGKIDQSFDRLVLENGSELTPFTAFLLIVACGLAIGGAIFVYSDQPLAGIAGMICGMIAILIVLHFRRKRRMQMIQEELPEMIDLLARSTHAGASLEQAITIVGEEAKGPLSFEFRRCARQLDMNMSVPSVMKSLSNRIQLIDLKILTSTLMLYRKTGGNLPANLERMAGVIRDRINYRRQMKASTGAGRASALLMTVVAPVAFVILMVAFPDHVSNLYTDPIGNILLLIAIVLEVIGILWVSALLRTEY
ncbi:MAG: type II secretion system F family protein [Planctomycetes bacterium]|nr:type II secretion system F family protein [Planctomycetota bacterium]MCH9726487.1 type II secretion system F family protein [Planctomycetota bacterium]MCH9778296.1 type II secretion system F family protein [Planctomycetota bacterium]MCH9789763.1 type II secretion system F family protein [Planctomycetota bacterium]MDF1743666.1 type II secretion system F family protein [Gimesia sp.]